MIPKLWFNHFPFSVDRITPVTGGDSNQAYRIDSGTTSYFLKIQPEKDISFFQSEVKGLGVLEKVVNTPAVIAVGEHEQIAYLLLEWIPQGRQHQTVLGETLAQLHQVTTTHFGFEDNNYLGMTRQINGWCESWTTFFLNNRLEIEIKRAKTKALWNDWREEKMNDLKEKILIEWPKRNLTPSLLHGDLWTGNVFFSMRGDAFFFDPAVYYGDREVDIAMTQLFGGFSYEFLDAYQHCYPLDTGWQERMPIYQLYYLLVHLNTFGPTYASSIDRILQLNWKGS